MKSRILFIAALALLYSCSQDPDPDPDPKVGDQWVVHYMDFDEAGGLSAEADVTITGIEVIHNGESWVELSSSMGSLGIFKMKSDGLHHLSNGVVDELFFTFPGTVGDSTALHLGTENYHHITMAVNQLTNIGSSTYTANYYNQYDANSLEAYIWFSENEWFVKFQEFDETTSGPPGMFMDYQYELVSYTPH